MGTVKIPPFDKEIKMAFDVKSVQSPCIVPFLTHTLGNLTFEQVHVHK